MTAMPATSAATVGGPWAGTSPKASAPKAIPASGPATLRVGSDACSGARV